MVYIFDEKSPFDYTIDILFDETLKNMSVENMF